MKRSTLSRFSLSLYELYNRFRVLRVVALRVIALWETLWRASGPPLESVSISPSIRSADQSAESSRWVGGWMIVKFDPAKRA